MTKDQFSQILNNIDDNLILKADKTAMVKAKRRKRGPWMIAACLCLIIGLAASGILWQGGPHDYLENTPTQTRDTSINDTQRPVSTVPDAEPDATRAPEIQATQGGPNVAPTARPTANATRLPEIHATQGEPNAAPTVKPTANATRLPSPSKTPSATVGTGEDYTDIVENPFVEASKTPTSYFSVDANTASYPNIRSLINNGLNVPKNAVRIEEMINYFSYDYTTPTDKLMALNAAMFDNPYNSGTKLLTIGLTTKEVEFAEVKNNLVFLIDTSGSMASTDKLPLVQQAFTMLANNLNPEDRVSIVTYAGGQRVALEGAYGYETAKIVGVIEDLLAGGGTAGSLGIQTAYDIAGRYFIEGGNNRVILATDGDFNVGITSSSGLEDFISQKRQSGIYLSVLGFGRGNIQSQKMETLALNGNGTYSYIDSVAQAKRALVDQIGGSIVTVAKDVKAGITFNPEFVKSYRLIGYENKSLTQQEFENTATDAGELGSGHSVTIVYEIELNKAFTAEDDIATVEIRYKSADGAVQEPQKLGVGGEVYRPMNHNDAFISSVVEFGLLLRDSKYKGDASYQGVISRLEGLELEDELKKEFALMVKKYAQSKK